jgi:hypothetical protein
VQQLRERGHAFLVLHNATLTLAHLASYDTPETIVSTSTPMLEVDRPGTASRPTTAGRPATAGLLGSDGAHDSLRLLGLLHEVANAHLPTAGGSFSGAGGNMRQRQRWVQLTIAEEGGIPVLARALGILGPAAVLRPISREGGTSSRPQSGARTIVAGSSHYSSGSRSSSGGRSGVPEVHGGSPTRTQVKRPHAPKGPARRPASTGNSSSVTSAPATDSAQYWTMAAVYGAGVDAPTSVGTLGGDVDAPRSVESVGTRWGTGGVDAPVSMGAVSYTSANSAMSGVTMRTDMNPSDEAAFAAHSRLEVSRLQAHELIQISTFGSIQILTAVLSLSELGS